MLTHHLLLSHGLEDHPSLGSHLLQMYGKCGAAPDSLSVFSSMRLRNVFAFNYVMGDCARHDRLPEASNLFHSMLQQSILPNRVTFVTLLSASSACHLSFGQCGTHIHARVMRSEFQEDVVVGTALVTMYGKVCKLNDAQRTFDSLLERNAVSWTALAALYANQRQHDVVLHLFQQMRTEGTLPDKVTYVNVLGSVSSDRMLDSGKRLHALIHLGGLESDIMLGNALINMYSQCGSLDDARTLLFMIPRRDVVSWTTVIVMCMEQGHGSEALHLFGQMQDEGVIPDLVCFMATLTACSKNGTLAEGNVIYLCLLNTDFLSNINVNAALVNMYGKCGSPDDAKRVFDTVLTRDVFLWNTMIAVYGQAEELKEALHLFEIMQRENKVLADVVTFVTMLDACAGKVALVEGKIVHTIVFSHGFEKDVIVCNAAINLYGKCGSLEDAQKMFDSMEQRNVITWTTVIAVYAQHGQGKVALQLFSQMEKEGPTPDAVTFLGLLVACKHSGLVVEGCQFFYFMTQVYRLSPGVDHFACMIDLLGRTGRIDAAEELFDKIPLQPTVEALTALLACGHQFHMKREECTLDYQMGFEMDTVFAEIKEHGDRKLLRCAG